MQLEGLQSAVFLSRLNRFAALVQRGDAQEMAHVPNSGRLKELLVPGVQAWVRPRFGPGKTASRLLMVRHGDGWVMVDAQLTNELAAEAVLQGKVPGLPAGLPLKKEVTRGNSRFDLMVQMGEEQHYIEVKCCTLVCDGIGYFPDAPTQRGAKHLNELAQMAREGGHAHVLFMVQNPGAQALRPNAVTDPAFAEALRAAFDAGVQLCALQCSITPQYAGAEYEVPIEL